VSPKRRTPAAVGRPQRSKERGEFATIDSIRRILGEPPEGSGVRLGIGDDAAVLRSAPGELVWTVDAQVENVHFRLDWLAPEDIGWRSFQAAASDLAAMGASPVGALSSLVLPAHFASVLELARGQAAASGSLACPIIGGNIARGAELSVTTTCLGRARRARLRSSASVRDEVWLVGDVGLAAAGLACLRERRAQEKLARARAGRAARACIQAWRRPRALVEAGVALSACAHAVVDVSDGLAADVGHIAEASGLAVILDEASLTAALRRELSVVARALGVTELEWALFGGEDYALCATGPARKRPPGASVIGRCEAGEGVWLGAVDGRRKLLRGGFDHLA
jgi:thiamine-monophosphate kinase